MPGPSAPPTVSRRLPALGAWWHGPQGALVAVALAAALLFLRKPWALATPQLYAEDGSIFLVGHETLGLHAWFTPYMGYLHLLPRAVAWFAGTCFDPRWWPACFVAAAAAGTLLVLFRFASPRFDVPGRSWLILSVGLVAQTGETVLSLTNLQWFTAFIFLQQALFAPPTGRWQRAGDLALVALGGLTGPFVLLFLPLLVWRAWRDRTLDTTAVAVVAGLCAAVQAWFLWGAESAPAAGGAWRPGFLAAALGGRLVVRPLLGFDVAIDFTARTHALVGGTALGWLLFRTLRPGARNPARLAVVAALALTTAAAVIRCRPDRWDWDDLTFSDRYFFMPRVLVAWLLVWECGAISRLAAWTARAACLAAVLLNIRGHVQPAPPDYRWADYCEPIRRGVPAQIPTLPEGWTLDYPGRPAPPP